MVNIEYLEVPMRHKTRAKKAKTSHYKKGHMRRSIFGVSSLSIKRDKKGKMNRQM